MNSIPRSTAPVTSPIEPAKAVAAVIAHGMNLPPGRVMLDYERWEIPNDGLFVVVGYLGPSTQLAGRSYFDTASDSEVQDLLNRHDVQIDLMSIVPDDSARLRRWEVPMSLNSYWSRNYCGQYGIGLQPLQSEMTDTSKLEPGGYLNRFTMRAAVFSSETRTLPAGYFNSFSAGLTVASQDGRSETVPIPMTEEP